MKKDKLILIFVVALIFGPLLFFHSCANTTEAPTGGPKDTIPPVVVAMNPLNGYTHAPQHGFNIELTFNEYVTIKTATNIFLSPPQDKMPKSKIRGKKLLISFEEDLKPNTTYTLTMTDAIADANEGNIFPGFTYVFSTGEQIDSMVITGTVLDSKQLKPVKGATVMVYRDLSDSAVVKQKPFAAVKTDDWGFFAIPYLQDTLYRLYAIKDASGNSKYDKEEDQIAFENEVVRPVIKITDSLPEIQPMDVKDTLKCKSRKSEHTLIMFREKPDKQFIKNKERPGDRTAYITFQAPNAWIDSLWMAGYPQDRIITQFNDMQDSLEIWVNDRRPAPDTLHLFVSYRKTDSLNNLHPDLEHIKLMLKDKDGNTIVKAKRPKRKEIKHEDTLCVFKMDAAPETIEQEGWRIEFANPIIEQNFNKVTLKYINPKQKEFDGEISWERDPENIRKYVIRPKQKFQKGYEYVLKIPHRAFRDITGFYSDSLITKTMLPSDQELSTLFVDCTNVEQTYIVELLNESESTVLRKYTIKEATKLEFPYLKPGKYCIRLTSDANDNNIVDSGSLFGHRQPEMVRFYELENEQRLIDVPATTEMTQSIDFKDLFSK